MVYQNIKPHTNRHTYNNIVAEKILQYTYMCILMSTILCQLPTNYYYMKTIISRGMPYVSNLPSVINFYSLLSAGIIHQRSHNLTSTFLSHTIRVLIIFKCSHLSGDIYKLVRQKSPRPAYMYWYDCRCIYFMTRSSGRCCPHYHPW